MWPLWCVILGWLLKAVIVTGNGLVIFLITTRRCLRTTTNCFILSLAVADFAYGLLYIKHSSWCPIPGGCSKERTQITVVIGSLFLFASVTNLCVLTLDRYLAIVKPLRYVTFMTKKRVILLIVVAWSVAFLVFILVFSLDIRLKLGDSIFVVLATLYLVICVCLSYATVRIFFIVRRIARQNAAVLVQLSFNYRIQHKMAFKSQETASAKMISVAVTFFVVCYVIDAISGFTMPWLNNETLGILNELLRLMNSAINPVAYAFFKREIRRQLKQLLPCTK